MQTCLFQLGAFTAHRFSGNPAAVMRLEACPDNDALQALAAGNNLAETPFLVPHGATSESAGSGCSSIWRPRAGRSALHPFQAFARDRVELEGACAFYLEGIAQW